MHDILHPINYAETFLYIRSKAGRTIPFYLNRVQLYIEAEKHKAIQQGKSPRFLILKYRRGGITTWEQAKSFCIAATRKGQYCVTLAHDDESTQKIFDISQLFYECLDERMRPARAMANKRELNFPSLGSKFYIGTAGSKSFGRGQTLQRVHGSEVAFWPESPGDDGRDRPTNLIAGLLEACSHGELVFETTPNGRRGFFYHEWNRARKNDSTFTNIFIPWWVDERNYLALQPGETLLPLDSEEIELMGKYNLSNEQIKFRRNKKKTLKTLFFQEYPEDDISCFITNDQCFFDTATIRNLIPLCKPPIVEREDDTIKIWELPAMGRRYIAGADTGEGVKNGDYSGVGILDVETGRQVASLHGRWSPEIFAEKAVKLCKEYNTALLAVESNNHGHSVLNTCLNNLYYPNLYYHKNYDATGGEKLGWQTNGKTRPIMLSGLRSAVQDNLMGINDIVFLDECFNFIDQGHGKYGASAGNHDDAVVKWAIAWQVRSENLHHDIIEYKPVSSRRMARAGAY